MKSERALSLAPARDGAGERAGFEEAYRRHFHDCCRWLQAMGTPAPEIEDLAQEVFVVVHRRIDEEPIENLAGWIYRIALRTVSDHRRRAWWRRLWSRRGTARSEDQVTTKDGLAALEAREDAARVQSLLGELSSRLRAALVLFEVLGYSGEEIAALEGIPVATVWTRLHGARRKFVELAAHRRMSEEP